MAICKYKYLIIKYIPTAIVGSVSLHGGTFKIQDSQNIYSCDFERFGDCPLATFLNRKKHYIFIEFLVK